MDGKKVFSVFELTSQIKLLLENRFSLIEVQGEVTNYKLSSTGHHYFTLKDEKASLNCVLFKTRLPAGGFPFKNGDLLIANGSIGLYEPSGTYQLIIKTIAKAGIGDLLAKIHALKEHFQALGYFETSIKTALPKSPKKIGIITSLTGAVIQDIIKVLNRRVHSYHLLIHPVKVQGEGSALEIKEAIETLDKNNLVDVMIIARGGGSFEDLLPFNDRLIVEAIHSAKTPIISAVGHETDYTLCDLASDVRAPTPSAAAEIVLPSTIEQITKIVHLSKRIQERLFHKLSTFQRTLESQKKFFYQQKIQQNISAFLFKLDHASEKLENILQKKLEKSHLQLETAFIRLNEKSPIKEQQKRKETLLKAKVLLDKQLFNLLQQKKEKQNRVYLQQIANHLKNQLLKKKEFLNSTEKRLSALNPTMILQKGYAIPFHQNSKSIIKSKSAIPQDEPFDLLFHDGKALVEIKQKKESIHD
jgi:exodeoxyribonuclease VII large subunit